MIEGRSQSGPDALDVAAIRTQLERVLSDEAFARAPVLSRLLRFIVEQGLGGDEASLKEYTLGVEVFDRGADFDPRTDTIVRVEARRLRARLRRYYAGAGRNDPVLIDIPKGHYLPAFRRRPEVAGTAPAAVPRRGARAAWLGVIGAALAVAVVVWWFASAPPHAMTARKAPPTIAVLPFLDLSPAGDQVHFSDGLTEEVLHLLARNPQLRVVARTSAFALRDERLEIPALAAKLGADLVLEGSVRREQDRVRVTAQLVDGDTGLHLWSETYDRDIGSVFAVQDEIAAAVAAATNVSVATGPVRAQGTDLAAYEHYLRGRFHLHRRADGDSGRARDHYRAALAIDPGFAPAWAGLAGVETLDIVAGRVPVSVGMRRQREAIERALALDPESAEVNARAAQHFGHAGETARARTHLERALTLAPNDPLVLSMVAGRERFAGRHEAAIALQRRAIAFDPVASSQHFNLGHYLLAAGRLAEAEAAFEQARALVPGQMPMFEVERALVRVLQGRFDEARTLLATVEDVPEAAVPRALLAAAEGDEATVAAVLAGLEARDSAVAEVDAARILAQRGDIDAAFGHLEAALARADLARPYSASRHELLQVRGDYLLRPLRKDPRWSGLADRLPGG